MDFSGSFPHRVSRARPGYLIPVCALAFWWLETPSRQVIFQRIFQPTAIPSLALTPMFQDFIWRLLVVCLRSAYSGASSLHMPRPSGPPRNPANPYD